VHVPGVFQNSHIQERLGQRAGHQKVGTHAVQCGVTLPVGVSTVSTRTARGRHDTNSSCCDVAIRQP
jgi:hypothetical protein